jgi:hypothetical protein
LCSYGFALVWHSAAVSCFVVGWLWLQAEYKAANFDQYKEQAASSAHLNTASGDLCLFCNRFDKSVNFETKQQPRGCMRRALAETVLPSLH